LRWAFWGGGLGGVGSLGVGPAWGFLPLGVCIGTAGGCGLVADGWLVVPPSVRLSVRGNLQRFECETKHTVQPRPWPAMGLGGDAGKEYRRQMIRWAKGSGGNDSGGQAGGARGEAPLGAP